MIPSRFPLILAPTPLHRLQRASESLNLDLWIKRDDLTGFAFGGNKGRKLEYLLAEIQASGAQAVLTCGAAQSNFIRQLGVGCLMLGVECHAAVMEVPFDQGAGRPKGALGGRSGNRRLAERAKVQFHDFPDDDWEVLFAQMEHVARELESGGKMVYRIPVGGSSFLGAYAFYEAAKELTEEFDTIVFASSSGSTQVGLATYFHGKPTRVLGIACDPEPEIAQDYAALSKELARATGLPELNAEDFELNFDYVGDGYGVPSKKGELATSWLLKREGIWLDPVYSAKAFSAILANMVYNEMGKKVLFWHTGGLPALFNDPTE